MLYSVNYRSLSDSISSMEWWCGTTLNSTRGVRIAWSVKAVLFMTPLLSGKVCSWMGITPNDRTAGKSILFYDLLEAAQLQVAAVAKSESRSR